MTKSILVVGATGQQGSAVIDALLNDKEAASFSVLGLTRSPDSASAKKLAERGVKIVQGDLNDVPAVFNTAKEVAGGHIWGVFVALVRSIRKLQWLAWFLIYYDRSLLGAAHLLQQKRLKAKLSLMEPLLMESNISSTPLLTGVVMLSRGRIRQMFLTSSPNITSSFISAKKPMTR